MAIKTFTTGEVLTASDTNTYLANSGLVYITSTTFTGASSVSVNNCFTSTFDQYRIIFNLTGTNAASFVAMRLRASGSDSGVNYSYVGVTYYLSGGSGYSTIRAGQNISYWTIGYANASGAVGGITVDLMNPKQSMSTTGNWTGQINDTNTGVEPLTAGGIHLTNYAADGFTILGVSAGITYTGTVTVYGYRKA